MRNTHTTTHTHTLIHTHIYILLHTHTHIHTDTHRHTHTHSCVSPMMSFKSSTCERHPHRLTRAFSSTTLMLEVISSGLGGTGGLEGGRRGERVRGGEKGEGKNRYTQIHTHTLTRTHGHTNTGRHTHTHTHTHTHNLTYC